MPTTSYPQRHSSAQFTCRSDIFVAIDMQGDVVVVIFIRRSWPCLRQAIHRIKGTAQSYTRSLFRLSRLLFINSSPDLMSLAGPSFARRS
mgnify:CR=1 FL=1